MHNDDPAAAITASPTEPPKPRLLDEVRRRMRVKRYSLRTEQAYLYWIRRYIRTNAPRHPRELGGMALEQFLSVLTRIQN